MPAAVRRLLMQSKAASFFVLGDADACGEHQLHNVILIGY